MRIVGLLLPCLSQAHSFVYPPWYVSQKALANAGVMLTGGFLDARMTNQISLIFPVLEMESALQMLHKLFT